ncbi:choline BCCT transporter BetT [Acinetobacter venetianus]|nr:MULTISPECIES: choline BCCT transporter BetT [Acinetobacter]MDA0694780.1 choline BCCT transporter BetT [Pseudomonadota bacterium]HBO71358.1 high-affinity choline transporter BetT [Acinetobacter sp.]KXO73880.1 choline transporter [Acinetobacter venetianus]KXO81667.1 choline transporter [Acinetobacter venetianus]MCR4530870.1 choline BCCT transporter BetT [Acinetobacter venetianus]
MPSKTISSLSNVNRNVFFSTVLIIAMFLVFAIVAPHLFETLTSQAKQWITDSFSWFYILCVAIFLVLLVYIACSSSGNIKLGPDHSQPEYGNGSWFAMLFTAGMGVGLMFFGVAEPVMHYVTPPNSDPETVAAAKEALRITLFHWGVHAWAVYALVGLSLAYFAYRHNLPLKTRSALYPIIGKRIYGRWGDAIDTFATVGTIFGVATSLGFGVLQVNAGLNYLFGIEQSVPTQIGLIIFVSILAGLSVFAGLDKGVKRLSELNLILAVLLVVFVFLAGPTIHLLRTTVENTGQYLSNLFVMTFNLQAYDSTGWIGGWTVFYWSWWIAWSPFVGMFIARVSRGRTVREFILGVILIPTGFTIVWMGFWGNAALFSIMQENNIALMEMVQKDSSVALFEFLNHLPFSGLMSMVAAILVLLFFVTSADSGALVVNYLTANTEDTPAWQRVFWVVLIAALTVCLLLVGGLATLQASMLVSALPFALIMMLMGWGLLKALNLDATKARMLNEARTTPRAINNPRSWQQRLGLIMHYPHTEEEVKVYIDTQVRKAFESIQREFKRRHLEVDIQNTEQGLQLRVDHHHEINFIYTVYAHETVPPSFMLGQGDADEAQYYQAEVFLREGGQNYDVMDWTQEDLIQDIIDQYERHLYFLNIVRGTAS